MDFGYYDGPTMRHTVKGARIVLPAFKLYFEPEA